MTDPVHQQHFVDRVDLQQVDRDIFTGWCHSGAPLRAYGGQIAAQSLMAAGRTVDQAERRVHSLHGYFLRPGGTKDSIAYLVDRPRDGRSFSTRFVRAVQNGETIFMMTASFATRDEGPRHQVPAPPLEMPDDLVEVFPALASHVTGTEERRALDYPDTSIIDLRVADPAQRLELVDGRYERLAWVRVREELPDDWLVQSCALTYLSDLTMVSTAMAPHVGTYQPDELMLASIDHAMWFHAPTRTDRWLLFAQDTPAASGGHGLARGLFFDAEGTLVASVVQESLMRTRREDPRR
ncbi:MAG: acyl-CoA thioesterase [Candidatus Nanopelagicales bacterium]